MQAKSPDQGKDLRQLLSRAAEAASYSGKKMMESAGLSWQTLSAWKAGTRKPRAQSIRAVGQVLLVRADRLRQVGLDLIRAAEQVPGQQTPTSTTDDELQRVLFAPSGLAKSTRQPSYSDGGRDSSDG